MGIFGRSQKRETTAPPPVPPPPGPPTAPPVRGETVAQERGVRADREVVADREVAAGSRRTVREERRWKELQRFRGVNLGAAVFGWLVTVGISVLLTALIAAGGTAVGLQQGSVADVSGSATTLTIGGGILLFLVLILSYYAGGYVAGRLSRFSGGVQGFAVWAIGAVITAVLAIAGVVAGSQYNVLGQLRLPSIPVKGQTLVDGAVVALCLITAATLAVSVLGGIVGRRYHSRVDRALEGRVPPV